jgi:predicted ATPase/class 3 adenylate cyclase
MESPEAYLPIDRCHAIARGQDLPDRTSGASLFADISGFTPLTEALVQEHGPKHGAEEIARKLNKVYDALIRQVHGYSGSVISFSGDAITCWFEGDDGRQSTTCAFEMQQAMAQFAQEPMPRAVTESLAVKIAVTAGPARRFVVGDPKIQLLDVLAGATLDRMAKAEKRARKDEVVVGEEVIQHRGDEARIAEWRIDEVTQQRFAVVSKVKGQNDMLVEPIPLPSLTEEQTRPWLLPPVYERLRAGQGHFLAEILPAVALFLKFGEIDYDQDNTAGEKLDSFVRWVQDILARFGGYLIQLTNGDKGSYLYAAFGAPLAHDDDPARAVAAALELRSLPPELDFITSVQIGISQGRMWTGAYGGSTRCTYGVLGDEVNVAARLMSEARSGQVLVTQRVADATGGLYHFRDLESVPVKGKQVRIPVSLALGIKPPAPPGLSTPYKHPLVGREKELAQMAQVLEAALVSEGQILRVEGAAGIGKSHLVSEFITRAASRGCRVAQGVCRSTSRDIAYYAWRWIFRSLFDVANEPSEGEERAAWIARQMAQVEATVSKTNPGWLARLPLLGELLGVPIPDNPTTAALNPEMRQQWLITLAVELIQTWARIHPLVLLLEDAHWMDEASQKLTQSLGRAIAQTPVVLTLAQRSQDEPLLPDLNRLSYHHHLDLRELPPDGIEALVSDRLQGKPSALALALIQVQAQGNPFFTEELVNNLRESGGLIKLADGTWTLSRAIFDTLRDAHCIVKDAARGEWVLAPDARLPAEDLGMPDSIDGIVLSRIDRLPETHKLTLKVASVAGPVFEFNLLARSHPLHPGSEALLEQVKALEARDFLRLETSPHGLTCTFKHTITQEVTYGTLLREQQRELHLAVGEAMEQLLPDEVERLAYHYRCCGARDKAMVYLDRSARKAQRAFANETALTYYNQALELEQRWEWRKGRVEVLHILGQRDDEQESLKTLEAASGAPAFDVASLWGQYYEAIAEYPQARVQVERALAAFQELSDVAGQVRCLNQLGAIAAREGKFDRAKDRYGQALDTLGDIAQILIRTLNGLGIAECQQGQFAESKKHFEQALELNRIHDNRLEEAQALSNLGLAAYYQRKFAEALAYHQQAFTIRQKIGDRVGEGSSLYNQAAIFLETGDYGQAQDCLLRALAVHQATGNLWDEAKVRNVLGVLFLTVGDWPQARACFQYGLKLAQEIGDKAGQADALCNLGLCHTGLFALENQNLEAAGQALTESLVLAQSFNDKALMAMCHSYQGLVDLQAGRPVQAIEQARAALGLRQELGLTLLTTIDLTTLSQAYLVSGDMPTALEYAHQAMNVLDECHGEGPEFPQRDYLICYRVFLAAGEEQTARACLQSAHELVMSKADKITDSALRRSFLERVQFNREIVQAMG